MNNSLSLVDVLFAGARQRVLAVLLQQPESDFHLRELARLTGSHAGTLTRELEKLSQAGLLLRTEQGNQVRYQANRACPLFDELAAIFRKTHGVVPTLRNGLALLAARIQVALLFGSVASGTQVAASDIDLLVIGDVGYSELVQAMYPLQQSLQREINPVLYAPAEFQVRAGMGDAFVRELQAKPKLFLIGDTHDFAELARGQTTSGARG